MNLTSDQSTLNIIFLVFAASKQVMELNKKTSKHSLKIANNEDKTLFIHPSHFQKGKYIRDWYAESPKLNRKGKIASR